MTTEERQQAMATPADTPPLKYMSFAEEFWGKSVAIVGNAPLERDYSAEIESADIVVRLNHAYRLGSGWAGKRTDILVITPTDTWLNLPPRAEGFNIAMEYHPKVVSIKFHQRLNWAKMREVFKGCEFYCVPDRDESLTRFTTGTMLLLMIAEGCEECEIKTYGFGTSAGFFEYLQHDGRHYLPNVEQEIAIREYAFSELAKLQRTRRGKEDYRIIIPARAGSSLQDKNIREFEGERLLDRCVKKCVSVFGADKVICLTDSRDYAKFANDAGGRAFILPPVSGGQDIARSVEYWRDVDGFEGNVAVVQCTSPYLSTSTLGKFKVLAEAFIPAGVCYVTTTFVKEKPTSFLLKRMSDNTLAQLYFEMPMSAPRQIQPALFRFTGAVALFSHRQLRNLPSFFAYAKLLGIETPMSEALDIDDASDFKCQRCQPSNAPEPAKPTEHMTIETVYGGGTQTPQPQGNPLVFGDTAG